KKKFVDAKLSTNFIAEEYPEGFSDKDLPAKDPAQLVAVAALVHSARMRRAATITGQIPGHGRKVPDSWVVVVSGHGEKDTEHKVTVATETGASGKVKVGKTTVQVASDWTFTDTLFVAKIDGAPATIQVDRRGVGYRLFHAGAQLDVMV